VSWITIGVAAVCFLLAVVIARVIVRKTSEREILFAVVLFLCFFLMISLSNQYILPEIDIWKKQKNLEKSLQEIAVYQQIAKSDPEIYERIKFEIHKSVRNRESNAQTTIRIRRIVNELVGKYLPRASDDAIFNYVSIMIKELEELTKLNPELSYEFLFPQKGEAMRHSFHLSSEMKKADLDSLAEVVRTGSTHPIIIHDFSEAKTLLEKVFINLHKVYGEDISLLRNPFAPGIYKEKYCNITIALFQEIFKLSKPKSCIVLRYMFSTKQAETT